MVAVQAWYALIGHAPIYLINLCNPTLSTWGILSLRSAEQGLHILFVRTSAGNFQEFSLKYSFSNLKTYHSASLGLGAPLSSPPWRGIMQVSAMNVMKPNKGHIIAQWLFPPMFRRRFNSTEECGCHNYKLIHTHMLFRDPLPGWVHNI